MTILVGIVLGETTEKPFAMVASDSRSTIIDVYHTTDYKIKKKEVISFIEDTKKVYKLSSNLCIGFAGNGFGNHAEVEVELIKNRLGSEGNIDLKEAAQSIRSFLFDRLYELNNEFYSYDIIIAGKHKESPGLAAFIVSHQTQNIEIQYSVPVPGQVMNFFGGERVPQHLKEKLHQQVAVSNGSITKVRLALTKFIQEASFHFESCNDITQVERVK